jgi:predicted DNA-binding transcriptional regulator AlpA
MIVEQDRSLITIQEVQALTGLSIRTIQRWAGTREHNFPSPIKLGRLTRWRSNDVQGWINQQGPSLSNTEGK